MVTKDAVLDKLLLDKFTSTFRKGYISVDGTTMPLRYQELQSQIGRWEVNENDVWICSFPKTGTTWTQEMVWMICNDLDFKGAEVNLGHRSPFFEVSAVFDYRDLMNNNKDFKPPPFLEDSLKFVKEQKSPVNIKTHLPWNLLPAQIRNGTKKPKIIYIARNPKDTCISYYHHCKLLEGYTGSFNEFCDLFLAGKVNFAPFWNHLLPFWRRRNESNMLFLKFEDMKRDLPNIVRQTSNFLNRPLTEGQVKILTHHLSFESMKENKAVNYELVMELNKKFKIIEHEGLFMRSGQVGEYKTVMSPEISCRFDHWTQKNTEDTGFSFNM